VIAASILVLVAGSLLARHRSGVAGQPASGSALAVIAILLIGTAGAIRLMILAGNSGKTVLARLAWTGPTIAYLLIAGVTSLPGVRGISWGVTWAVVVATEVAWWLAWLSRGPGQQVSTESRVEKPSAETPRGSPPDRVETIHGELGSDGADAELNELLPPEMTRRASRSSTAEEGQRLDVLMRLTFPAGQRSQFAHLPIHPPLPGVPDVTCHQLAGPACSISVSESQSFGIRLEIRLSQLPGEEVEIMLQVEAVVAPDHSEAA
jgi:hypothetical protein